MYIYLFQGTILLFVVVGPCTSTFDGENFTKLRDDSVIGDAEPINVVIVVAHRLSPDGLFSTSNSSSNFDPWEEYLASHLPAILIL